jgi:hypothetical protein
MFPPPLQKAFDTFCIHLISMKYQQALLSVHWCQIPSPKFMELHQFCKQWNFQPQTMDANDNKTSKA